MILTPEAVVLRPTQEQDLAFVLEAEHHEENCRYIGQWTRERHWAAISGAGMAHVILERAEDAEPVGYAILRGIGDSDGSIEVKRLTVTEKGRGYGRAALRLIKRLAFEELGAHRLWLDVMESNARARHVYESEGFVVEGILRERLKVGEEYESLIIMSVLESEYRA